jgi:hypothetical protein
VEIFPALTAFAAERLNATTLRITAAGSFL